MSFRNTWEIVTDHQCELGEGPVWDADQNRIIWVDIISGEIHSFYLSTHKHTTIQLHEMVGAVALRRTGGLVAALQSGIYTVDEHSGQTTFIHNPEKHIQGNRFNDGKCDPQGRFWIGSMSIDESIVNGNLYRFDGNWQLFHFERHIGCSNGLAWSSDSKIMYYIDSPTRKVFAYDYEANLGTIFNKRVVITIPEGKGFPDGMTIDTEGMLWIALWGGWGIVRYNPHTGELLEKIAIPVEKVTSCTFGGPNLSDLYVTTASRDLTEEERKAQPLAGSLFVIKDLPYRGRPTDLFKG